MAAAIQKADLKTYVCVQALAISGFVGFLLARSAQKTRVITLIATICEDQQRFISVREP